MPTITKEADVLVAGAGVSGVFAALAAAREGAKVVVADRFGQVGGNMGGAGMILGGGIGVGLQKEFLRKDAPDSMGSIVADFLWRVEKIIQRTEQSYPVTAQVFSYVATKMLQEAGVEMMLSCFAGEPILDGDRLAGSFVETVSGRVAVRAKVTIDATGDASVAAKAGAPVISRQPPEGLETESVRPFYRMPGHRYYNDGGAGYLVTGMDYRRFETWLNAAPTRPLTAEEEQWSEQQRLRSYSGTFVWWKQSGMIIPHLRAAAEAGAFAIVKEVRPGLFVEFTKWFDPIDAEVIFGRAHVYGEWDTGRWEDISLAEQALRLHIFEGVQWMRGNVPGWNRAALAAMGPFLGARGGPCIDAEYVLHPNDAFAGLRHPHTMFVAFSEVHRGGHPGGHDAPYEMLVPKRIGGLLVTGRGAGWIRRGHDPSFRARVQMMNFGQAAGEAAALCLKTGAPPRQLDVRLLQKKLLAGGFHLGDAKRLAELGLA